jgi:Ca2+-binding EF-hand superfamily protein
LKLNNSGNINLIKIKIKKREQFLNIFDKNIMASFLEKKIRTLFVRFDMDGNGAIEGLFILFLKYILYIY